MVVSQEDWKHDTVTTSICIHLPIVYDRGSLVGERSNVKRETLGLTSGFG